jgi:hypothetical protein
MASNCSSTTASQSQTKGHPILSQSPHGSIILISRLIQGLEAPYVTKWCLKDWNRSVLSGNQRENKSLHLPALPQSFTIGILSVIPRKNADWLVSMEFWEVFVVWPSWRSSLWPTSTGRTSVHNLGLFNKLMWHLNILYVARREQVNGWEAKSGCDVATLPQTWKHDTCQWQLLRWQNSLLTFEKLQFGGWILLA